jgi:ribonuclease G
LKKEIVVSVDREETRAGILEDGRLVEFFLDRPLDERIVGNIYKGKVENVLPGMQAAFVNIGLDKNAFLYVDDAYPATEAEAHRVPDNSRNLTIKDLVSEGQSAIVQVAKEPSGTKGARITRNITIPGRFLVLMPTVDYVGVSRRITDDDERERLKKLAERIKPNNVGVIVRTVAEGKGRRELEQDMKFLNKVWSDLKKRARERRAPAVLHKDKGLVYRIIRDMLTEDVNNLYIDSREEHRNIMDLLDAFSPKLKNRIHLHEDSRYDLFEKYGINEEIDKALKRRVWLKCGGYIVIDQLEALTAIDVNTGKYVGSKRLEETVFKTNMEAVEEIVRQLRLRDIGGIIIIDFIDMEERKHRQKLLNSLEEALEKDRTKGTILGITKLGLVEMTRKKSRKSLKGLMTKECPYCEGRGHVHTEESMNRKVRREIKRILRHADSEAILVEVHPSVAALLIGSGGQNLRELERELDKSIYIKGSDDCHIEDLNLRALGSKQEVEERALPVQAGEVLELQVEEPHVSNLWDGIARVEGYVVDIEGAGDRVGEKVKVEITKAFRTYAKAKIV